jgi:hypothetical protein
MKMQGGIGGCNGDGGPIVAPVAEDAHCMEARETAPPTPSHMPPPGTRLMQQAMAAGEQRLQHKLVSGAGDMAVVPGQRDVVFPNDAVHACIAVCLRDLLCHSLSIRVIVVATISLPLQ